MVEVKHTPGPWVAKPCRQTPDRGSVFVEGPHGWELDPICSTYENTTRELNEANARLIAAAPRMYQFVLDLAKGGNADAARIIAEIG